MTDKPIDPINALDDLQMCRTLLAVMVHWNSGEPIVFTQEDLDAVVGAQILSGLTQDMKFCIGLARPTAEVPRIITLQ